MILTNQEKNWRYVFFVECLHIGGNYGTHTQDAEYQKLLQGLKKVTEKVCLLGRWKSRLT